MFGFFILLDTFTEHLSLENEGFLIHVYNIGTVYFWFYTSNKSAIPFVLDCKNIFIIASAKILL